MIKKYLDIVNDTPLFSNVTYNEMNDLLNCMNARAKKFEKDSFIFFTGDTPEGVGILLEGAALIIKEDLFGNRTVISRVEPGEIFGEVFSCALVEELPISVIAESDCQVLILDYKKVITTCSSSCKFHNMLIKNMLKILAQKNLYMNRQNDILSSKTTREKLLKYLESVGEEKNAFTFSVPYNRQELADLLGVNRSAMTRELANLKEEGVIDFDKNSFTLKN